MYSHDEICIPLTLQADSAPRVRVNALQLGPAPAGPGHQRLTQAGFLALAQAAKGEKAEVGTWFRPQPNGPKLSGEEAPQSFVARTLQCLETPNGLARGLRYFYGFLFLKSTGLWLSSE